MVRLRDNIVTFDFDTLWTDFSDTACELVALSERDVSILLSSLRVAKWGTRWLAGDLLLRDISRGDDLETALTYVETLERKLLMTGCLEGLIDTLSAINTTLAGLSSGVGCGCGSGGAGSSDVPASSVAPGPPGERSGDPPEGFDTWSEYETYKCKVATWIVEAIQSDLDWFEVGNIVALTAAGLAVGLVTPVPGDELLLLLGFLLALAAQEVLGEAIDEMQAAMVADYDDYVCALYNAGDVATAKANWEAVVDTSIDGQTEAFYAFICKAILNGFATNTLLNKLVEDDTALDLHETEGDCSSCGACEPTFVTGSGNLDTGGVISAEYVGEDNYEVEFWFGSRKKVTLSGLTGWSERTSPYESFKAWYDRDWGCGDDFTSGLIYQSDTSPFTPSWSMDCCGRVKIFSATDFYFTLTIVGEGESCP